MDLHDAKALVCGATGALGGQISTALHERGARVAVAGRNSARLQEVASDLDGAPSYVFDAVDEQSCRRAVDGAAAALGGLDLLVVTVGAAGFGPAMQTDAATAEELFAVNTLGPMELVRAADAHLEQGGTVLVISAILADMPTAQMAEYSAAKSALATWLRVLRQEQRRRLNVIDVRPPHLDTGLDTRAIAGTPPKLPEPRAATDIVDAVLQAIEEDAKEIVFDVKAGELQVS